ncbi:MAG: beta-ketoacyl-ACP synthase [Deltaproteobacteria bacterium]|nr:MAG: beta-ketoacyl-ACP synthase [Deltaproteobacteria bacterium]
MADSTPYFLTELGMVCALGDKPNTIATKLQSGASSDLTPFSITQEEERSVLVGRVQVPVPEIPEQLLDVASRNMALLLAAYVPIAGEVEACKEAYGSDRVGVVLGASAQGIDVGEESYAYHREHGEFPETYHYNQQELGYAAEAIARFAGLHGPAYCIGTSCSSSAKALIAARNLLASNICDAVVVGGVDSLCQLTVQGFSSLDAVSPCMSNPMSRNRDGITLGEGAALFVMSREASTRRQGPSVLLLGAGESCDAHHISSPDPSGQGAIRAMKGALNNANLRPEQVDYINMHGTGTVLNDAMESKAIAEVFGEETPCSSTKPLTGHTLGAAGALEVGICWLTLTQNARSAKPWLPLHVWDGEADDSLPHLHLVSSSTPIASSPQIVLTNSFAFGGNNASLILGVER